MRHHIDLNADLGEGFGPYQYGADQELLPLVTSANIACGWHGGDPGVMRQAVRVAREHGVTIGAHPGYPDRMGFGRRNMSLSPQEVTDGILYQLGALEGLCRAEGTAVRYVKPHGALYNTAAQDPVLAAAVVEAVRLFGAGLVLLCPWGSTMAQAAQAAGLPIAREFFADRGYQEDGSLVPRGQPGAILSEPESVCRRVIRAVKEGVVETFSGREIAVEMDSICLHGDTSAAVVLAGCIRRALEMEGVLLRPFAEGGIHIGTVG